MSEFASPEQCEAAVDAVAALIPQDKLYHLSEKGGIGLDEKFGWVKVVPGSRPRDGWGQGYWAGKVVFNGLIPRAWYAHVHEPYQAVPVDVGGSVPREVYTKAQLGRDDPRASFAKFETYGLDVYDADPVYRWGQLDWQVVRTLSAAGSLAIFADNPYFIHAKRFTTAMVEAGHARYDEPEAEALFAATNRGSRWITEETARLRCLRLTATGAGYLLDVLQHTKNLQEVFAAHAADTWAAHPGPALNSAS